MYFFRRCSGEGTQETLRKHKGTLLHPLRTALTITDRVKFYPVFLFPEREHSPEFSLLVNAFPHLSLQAHNMQI